jgi:mono/diheme cytochrome c family protein
LLQGSEELDAATILDAPTVNIANVAPADRDAVRRGEYMVELLGCGTCHTDGAFEGAPDSDRSLAGSATGIAYTTPLEDRYPGIVFPSNITPDLKTGIGGWSDAQLAASIRQGQGRHGSRQRLIMPWPGYARLSDEDTVAIVRYLQSLEPVKHQVPDNVQPGEASNQPYIYFGVYRTTE